MQAPILKLVFIDLRQSICNTKINTVNNTHDVITTI